MSKSNGGGPRAGSQPKRDRGLSDGSSEQVPPQQSVEDDGSDADNSLVKQMSHADESLVHDGDTETRGVVGYVDEHGMENRPEEGTRRHDTE